MEYGAVQLRWSANYGTDGEGSFQFGLIDFDNFARAFLTIFQVITLEGWTDIMYVLMDAYDPWLTGIFFCFLVLFGSFFVLNLLLAVLEQNYNEQEQMMTDRENAKKAEKERLLQEKRKLALGLLEGADDQVRDRARNMMHRATHHYIHASSYSSTNAKLLTQLCSSHVPPPLPSLLASPATPAVSMRWITFLEATSSYRSQCYPIGSRSSWRANRMASPSSGDKS